ncbi:hypothetical protein, partial [Paraburkholderia phenoliruptrix]
MELDAETFRRLRRLAPVLDDILNAGEVEHAEQAVNLEELAHLCSQMFEAYDREHLLRPGLFEDRHPALFEMKRNGLSRAAIEVHMMKQGAG